MRSNFDDMLFLGADYYFDASLSLGAWIEDYGNASIDNRYGLRTEKFFTPNVSLQGSYFHFRDSDIWQVAVRLRF